MLTQQEAYESLSPFIQDYIYEKKWKSLNLLQVATIDALMDEVHGKNLLLTAGTSQGKTEAAFLPCLSHIEGMQDSVGILYISPLKALINDQFVRLEDMLKKSDLHITKWHGDASIAQKENLLEHPGGILQMTPESLEAMFCRYPNRMEILFSRLKYIIIDEIHYFISDQRGIQLLILLERLQKRSACNPVRIGLSATIQDTEAALEYLNKGSARSGKVISVKALGQQAFVSVTATPIGMEEFPERFIKKMFKQTEGRRTLLFTNSRRQCEIIINKLRAYAMEHKKPDIYHIHHGSISKQIRESTETAMKTSDTPVCTGTTMTLELGIDIGSLDEVIQASDPISISSMVQRLGRSGRRTGKSSISFQLRQQDDKGDRKKLDLQLIRSIAMIELYFRDHYMEIMKMPRYPYRLLVHTILSIICEKGCLQAHLIAYHVKAISVFENVSLDDLRDILNAMLDKKILTLYDDGAIGLGDQGEKLVNQLDFYSVFEPTENMTVYYLGAEIGTVERVYQPGDLFFLNGFVWEVMSSDRNSHRIDVEESEGEADIQYYGSGFLQTDQRVMQKMHQILSSEEDYRYLDSTAKGILQDLREKAVKYKLVKSESSDASQDTATAEIENKEVHLQHLNKRIASQHVGAEKHSQNVNEEIKAQHVSTEIHAQNTNEEIDTQNVSSEVTEGKIEESRKEKTMLLGYITEENDTNSLLCCPGISSNTIYTLFHILRAHDISCERIYLRELLYGIRIHQTNLRTFARECGRLCKEKYLIDDAYVARSLKYNGRYFNMLPDHLKAREIKEDLMNLAGAREYLELVGKYVVS